MKMPKQVTEHPFPVGSNVLVHGQRGRVISVEDIGGNRFRYEILLEDTAQAQKWMTPPTDIRPWLGPIEMALSNQFSSPLQYDLRTESLRLSLAYEYDRMVSLSSSRVNLEPYQVEAVHRVVNSFPHRFLIADDTGLGKTIETGMILEELMARSRADRVLILAPVGVCRNWKRELKECFGRDYILYDGPYLRQLMEKLPPEQNPWEHHPRIIASLDLAKRDEVRAQLERPGCRWDTAIFDEAHKLSSRIYGSKVEETQRYRLGRAMAERSDSFLLLSATPHNGDRYTFNALLSLLDEFAFPAPELLDPKHVGQFTIRRVKKEILDEHGKPVFVDRDVRTWPVKYTKPEIELYNAVTQYVIEGFNLAKTLEKENRAIGFVMVLFQKRMVSSIQAIRLSLTRRLNALRDHLKNLDQAQAELRINAEDQRRLADYEEDPDSLDDHDRQDLESKLEILPAKFERELIEREISQLEPLTALAASVTVDSKKDELLSFLQGILTVDPTQKVIVFTEYTDTLRYLESQISQSTLFKQNQWKICLIHGGMNQDQREEAQRALEQPNTKIMIATDAAGEGINLHWSCHIMVNYELPWKAYKIQQRIGRLHRYGQKRDVTVYNLFVTNTREDQILENILKQLVLIGRDMPGDPYDVLGALLEQVDLTDLVMTALIQKEEPQVTVKKAAQAARERAKMLEHIDKELFQEIRRYDHQHALHLLDRVKQTSATSQHVAQLAEAFLLSHGSRITKTKKPGVLRIRDIPQMVRRQGVMPAYESVTFHRETAREHRPDEVQLVAFGHPLFDSIVSYCTQAGPGFDGTTTAKTIQNDHRQGEPGALFNFRLKCTDGRGTVAHEELHPVYVSESGTPDLNTATQFPRFDTNELTPPTLMDGHLKVLADLEHIHSAAWELAVTRSKELEDTVQERRLATVEGMKHDLDRYASARETKIQVQRSVIEERLHQYKLQPQLIPSGQDIRILGEEARLRDLDQETERLHDRVVARREELGNMEIIVAERPELVSLALIEFR
ncbi:MAG: DEAD/DEAH box helicase [Dehalococcoidia bacterium]|nr:DEAD/DEAH box helicase [Dehalococcoidia bacterium]